ncbi:hypothetical protein F9B74_06925 [Pelistega sp. NLN82]|uniref:DUF7716 domain-containing protein n=1 Tax=Pelistega ratti TaxID=2652177 RepID=A0A6L9Y8I7_9BURK|nr:hypothetical protein [Pelistega ratti]NEN76054.1 hypothetical protein [Pelistega ratti]
MKTFENFNELLKTINHLPHTWIFTDKPLKISLENILKFNKYYIPDYIEEYGEYEECDMEESGLYDSFIECQTFKAIIDNKLEHNPNSTMNELAEAVLYYLKNDDFLD